MSEPEISKCPRPSSTNSDKISAILVSALRRSREMTVKGEESGGTAEVVAGKNEQNGAQDKMKAMEPVNERSCGSADNEEDQARSQQVDDKGAEKDEDDGAVDVEEEADVDNDEPDDDDDYDDDESYYESSAVFTDDNSEASSDNDGDGKRNEDDDDDDDSNSASDDSGDVYVASEEARWDLAGGLVYEEHSDEHVAAVRKDLGMTDWVAELETAKAAQKDSHTDSSIDPSLRSLNAELADLRLRSKYFDQSQAETNSLLIRYIQSQSELRAERYVSDLHRRLVRSTQIELVTLKQSKMSLEEEMIILRSERDQAKIEKKDMEGRLKIAEKGQRGAEDKLAMVREAHDLERGMYLNKIKEMQRELDRQQGYVQE